MTTYIESSIEELKYAIQCRFLAETMLSIADHCGPNDNPPDASEIFFVWQRACKEHLNPAHNYEMDTFKSIFKHFEDISRYTPKP